MPTPIGINMADGAVVQISSPAEVRALELFAQLEAWRTKGYDPQLWGTPDGWVLVIDMTHWGMRDIGERNPNMTLRFNTARCETPEATIEAALQVIQP